MKNSIRITLAVVLFLLGLWGYNARRPRALTDCFPEGTWESVSVADFVPEPGEAGDVFDLAMTPEEVREAMAGVTVFHRGKFNGWGCANLTLRIRIGEKTMTAEIGEDGCVAIADLLDLSGSRTYWCAKDGRLYEALSDVSA